MLYVNTVTLGPLEKEDKAVWGLGKDEIKAITSKDAVSWKMVREG